MRVFPHGNVVNFEASVREMTAPGLERLLTSVIDSRSPVMTGLLDMAAEAVYVYGRAETVAVDEESGEVTVTARTPEGETHRKRFAFADLILSHEMHFDVVEEEGGVPIRYPVYYVTFAGEGDREISLFFAGEEEVGQPLHYVVEYWNQAGEAGRDAQFHAGGCSIPPDFTARLKNR